MTGDAYIVRPSAVPECVYHYTDACGPEGALDGTTGSRSTRFIRVVREIDREIVQEIARATACPGEEITDDAARTFVAVRAAISKHNSCVAENEGGVAILTRKTLEHDIKVWTSGDRLVPYVALEFGASQLSLLRIGIGPEFAGTQDVDAVRRLCVNNGYDPDLYFANTPYRRL